MKEYPLVIFTLAIQFACGLTLAATVSETAVPTIDAELIRPLAIAIFPIVAMGILVSISHLGRPFRSWRTWLNFRQSRLSLEAILTAVFALLALAYSGAWWIGRAEGRPALGCVTSLSGIAALVAAAAVYTVPAQPVWNSGWVPASFAGTALLLGGFAPAVLVPWAGNSELLRVFLIATMAGSSLQLVATVWMLAHLSRRTGDPFTGNRLASMLQSCPVRAYVWLGCHVALASILPAAVAFRLWPNGTVGITPMAAATIAVVVLGAAIGRTMMYWLRARWEPF